MKPLSFLLVVGLFFSCQSSEPYLKYELAAEKKGVCSQAATNTKMTSNIAGERYEFYACLPDNFEVKDFSVGRKGDSLLTNLSDIKITGKTSLFKLTLDIDVYPKYRFIKLGEDNVVALAPEY